jgi:thiol:disulfide interchange protein DsbD
VQRRTLPWLVVVAILLVPALAAAGTTNCEFAEYQDRGWMWMFLGSFGFGFLTSLTPCVYPMIPITLAIFGARGDNVPRKRALGLAFAYVNGMCLTYTILGVTFAMIGKAGDFGTQLASPYVVIPLVLLFLALAASMFGAFDLNLPASWQAKLNQVGGKGFGGAFAMGLVGGLIAAPCTGPFLAGLLAYVSTTGNAVGGGALLYVYGLGMGILFFVLAAFAVSLPKSGRWMDAVKSIGGIGLVIAALYYLQPLVPALTFGRPELWFAGMMLAIAVVGIALGAINLSFHGPWPERVRKGVGVVLVVVGALGIWQWKVTPERNLPFERDEATAFAKARAEHKGVMIDFGADWCRPCHDMDVIFGDADVYTAITKSFVPLRFDVSANTDANDAIKSQWGAETLPTVLFLETDKTELYRINKEIKTSGAMLDIVKQAASHTVASSNPCKR